MNKISEINKKAWEYRTYEYLIKSAGRPEELAKVIKENPRKRLKTHMKYFEDVKGKKIANICGSNGRRAVALSLLGAEVSIFDISEDNKRYALDLAKNLKIDLNYVLGDVYDIDLDLYGNFFDILYLEGGILHNFHEIDRLIEKLYALLKIGGKIVLNDFHPFRKVMEINFFKSSVNDYFDTNIHKGDVAYKDFIDLAEDEEVPECLYRYYNLSEIMNSIINAGFIIKEFNEEASWTNDKLPGEITIYAKK